MVDLITAVGRLRSETDQGGDLLRQLLNRRNLPQTRKGRIWPYVGGRDHPAIIYDYTPTRKRAGPEEFLKDFRGHLQANAYAVYDSFFADPARGTVEVGA